MDTLVTCDTVVSSSFLGRKLLKITEHKTITDSLGNIIETCVSQKMHTDNYNAGDQNNIIISSGNFDGSFMRPFMEYMFEYGYVILGLLFLFLMVPVLVGQWKVFKKAGKSGYAALIPVYNIILFLEITGKPKWWIILFLIPGVNMVMRIILLNGLSNSFGKDAGYTVGLYFLPMIFFPLLGFSDDEYQGPSGIL